MAFNWQTFRTRTITAAVFVVVMLAGLLFNHWTFFILFSVIHFGCWIEYQRIVGLIDKDYAGITPFHKYGVMIAGWCIMLYFTNDAFILFRLRLHELGWWLGLMFIFILPIIELLFARHIQLKNIGYSALGLLYISLSWALMMDLYDHTLIVSNILYPYPEQSNTKISFNRPWIIPAIIIACLWINDTMAYIVGSLIGKKQLSKISPKKTWEGTLGGIILCVFIIGYTLSSIPIYSEPLLFEIGYHWYVIAAIAAIAGTFGDLLESRLKRMAGVKDSGHIMPGHGGFLDRFDSLLLAIPFVWLYVEIVISS